MTACKIMHINYAVSAIIDALFDDGSDNDDQLIARGTAAACGTNFELHRNDAVEVPLLTSVPRKLNPRRLRRVG